MVGGGQARENHNASMWTPFQAIVWKAPKTTSWKACVTMTI
jgi:hypothetical protein